MEHKNRTLCQSFQQKNTFLLKQVLNSIYDIVEKKLPVVLFLLFPKMLFQVNISSIKGLGRTPQQYLDHF